MANAVYNRDWPKVRLAILDRDRWLCQIKGSTCRQAATEVDHIIPVSEGGSWRDPSNLRGVCRPCHNGRKKSRIIIVKREEAVPSRIW